MLIVLVALIETPPRFAPISVFLGFPGTNSDLPPSVDPNDQKKTACYDIDVEVEDPLKSQMSSFLLSTANQQEIASLDNKVSIF